MLIKKRLAIVVSHPIQHFCPQYESFANNELIELKVFFASSLGFRKYHDPNFGKEISWDNLMLDTFDHEFLNKGELIPADKNIDAPELDEKLASFKPDALIIYGYFQKLNRRAYYWARKNRVRLLYISDSERNRNSNPLTEMLKFPFLYRFFTGIDYFLTVGDSNEGYYKFYQVPTKKFIRMHFPIDVRLYKYAYEKRKNLRLETRNKYSIEDSAIVLSVVGKLVSWKNQGDIIDAMIRLEKEKIILSLFIIGSGEMMDEWKKKAEQLKYSKVFFTGFVKPKDLPAYYAATDIYIHPASLEPHSLAISEAIYMGCPILLSNRCGSYGPEDDVQPGRNGVIYLFGNIEQLIASIKSMLLNRSELNAMANYSHEIALKFQASAHSNVIERIVQKLSQIHE